MDFAYSSEKFVTFRHSSKDVQDLVGKRVRIRAIKEFGSARLLNGLTGTVVAMHPVAAGWVKINLDINPITPYQDWSVAIDRLVSLETDSRLCA